MNEHVDLLVIGWGKGGKTLAAAMAKAGKRVAMVEQSDQMYGGTCINIGCVPTKTLVHDADTRRDGDDPQTWFRNAVSRRDTLTAAMRRKNFSMLDSLDSALAITGRATFVGPREVEVAAGNDRLRITADTMVLNTGALPAALPLGRPSDGSSSGAGAGGRIHDSTSLQHIGDLPRHLVVVGGGYVGLEFASMFAHFGSEVTVLDRGGRPLRREDPDVSDVTVRAMEEDGVRFVTSASVTGIEETDRAASVSYTVDNNSHSLEADAVLVALGRRPATDGLNLEAAGVQTDDGGYVVVDERLRTSAEGVFAIGDVKGGPQFTYVSLDDYRIVADQLLGQGRRFTDDRAAVPYTIFLTPPLARVGLTERQARDAGHEVLVAVKEVPDIAAMPRPKIVGEARGIVKVIVDAANGMVLGAALMHVDSQEVINLVAMAMRHRITAGELRDAVYTHPSSTEALNEVLGSLG